MGLLERIVALEKKVAEQDRRNRNRRRTGTVAEVDYEKGAYRVKLGEQDGKPYLTGWIKGRPLGAGATKIEVLFKVGEQVDVVSESGDLTDARIEMADYSENNPRENTDTPFHVKIGSTVFAVSDGLVDIISAVKITGPFEVTGDTFTHNGKDVGDTHRHADVTPGPSPTGLPL
jgi:phage baseplate assembly protein gpV